MGSMSIGHWVLVAGVAVLLFGRGKISGLMGDVAQGIKAFRNGLSDDVATAPNDSLRTIEPPKRPA